MNMVISVLVATWFVCCGALSVALLKGWRNVALLKGWRK
jgi:hypothetical protein